MSRARLAGQIFNAAKSAAKWPFNGMGKGEIALRLAPDAAFATMNAVQTPGDLGDKLIAGSTDFIGSGLTGLVVSKPFKGPTGAVVDQIGSIGGMYGGMAVSDVAQRNKDRLMGGEGLSAYERSSLEYEKQLRAQVIAELDAAGMLSPEMRALLPTNDNTGMV